MCIATNVNFVFAYESDSKKPIFLESDSAKWDEETQKSTYRGNVVVTQGTMLLTGDLLIVTSENNEINKMTITGKKQHINKKLKVVKLLTEKLIKLNTL